MIFIKDLGNKPLNTYNNNIVEYKATDTNKTVVKSTIEISGTMIELTPNLNDEFRFNLKRIAQVLNNQNDFKDEIEPDLVVSNLYEDTTLSNDLICNFKIIFDNETEETDTKIYKFFKSVEQIVRSKVSFDDRLFPLVPNNSNLIELTYFEGYPFDIPFYSNDDRDVTVLNKKTGSQITLSSTEGVNRFFISDGKTNTNIEGQFLLTVGFNELEFKIGNEILFTIQLRKVDSKKGLYLKWFNQSGAFSYWLFPNTYRTILSTKTISNIFTDFENLDDTLGNIGITGKSGSKSIELVSQELTGKEFDNVEQIFTSKRVEILNKEIFSEITSSDWVSVKVVDSKTKKDHRALRQYLPVKIQLPTLYTQTS